MPDGRSRWREGGKAKKKCAVANMASWEGEEMEREAVPFAMTSWDAVRRADQSVLRFFVGAVEISTLSIAVRINVKAGGNVVVGERGPAYPKVYYFLLFVWLSNTPALCK